MKWLILVFNWIHIFVCHIQVWMACLLVIRSCITHSLLKMLSWIWAAYIEILLTSCTNKYTQYNVFIKKYLILFCVLESYLDYSSKKAQAITMNPEFKIQML